MLKTLKLRLYPTEEQKNKLEYLFIARRWLWNHFITINNQIALTNEALSHGFRWRGHSSNGNQPIYSRYDINKEITKLRPNVREIENCPVNILQSVAEDIGNVYDKYYNYESKLPYKVNNKTFRLTIAPTMGKVYLVNSKHKIYLTGVMKHHCWLKTLLKDPTEGIRFRGYANKKEIETIKTVTVLCDKLGHYYACVVYEVKEEYLKKVRGNKSIGIDLGIKKFLTDSKGNKAISPDYDKLLKRIDNLKSIQDTLQDNSKQHRIGRLWDKINNIRNNYLHQLSSYYTSIYKNIYIEDLNIKPMLSKTGQESNDYKIKAINTKLRKGISNQGWSIFINMLKYKSNYYSNNLIEVDSKFTSQTCYICKHADKNSRQGEVFRCTKCGYVNDADVNAAKNILEKGKVLKAS